MIGEILTKHQVKKLGLKPTGQTFGESKPSWQFFKSPKFLALLVELNDGSFAVRTWADS